MTLTWEERAELAELDDVEMIAVLRLMREGKTFAVTLAQVAARGPRWSTREGTGSFGGNR